MRERRRAIALVPAEVDALPTPPEVDKPTGRPRLDPAHDQAPIMSFRATGKLEARVRDIVKHTGASYSEVCRRAMELGLDAIQRPRESVSRPGKI